MPGPKQKNNLSTITRDETPLYGLVLTGGKSTRMQTDKSLLKYHGKTQVEHCFELLRPYCTKVFISNREEQSELSGHKNFPQIHDFVTGIGPLGGILSAMAQHPNTAWFVLACDLPYVNSDVIKTLIEKRNLLKMATAFQSAHDGLPEPLCTIYEPKSIFQLLQFLTDGHICPRKILLHSDVQIIKPIGAFYLENINDPQEYQKAHNALKTQLLYNDT